MPHTAKPIPNPAFDRLRAATPRNDQQSTRIRLFLPVSAETPVVIARRLGTRYVPDVA